MRTQQLSVLLLAVLVSPALLFAAGTVNGKITYTGTPAKQKVIDMSKEPSCAKQHTTPVTTEGVVTGRSGSARPTTSVPVALGWTPTTAARIRKCMPGSSGRRTIRSCSPWTLPRV